MGRINLGKKKGAKLTAQTAYLIRDIVKSGQTTVEQAAERYNSSPQAVKDIVNEKTWPESERTHIEFFRIEGDGTLIPDRRQDKTRTTAQQWGDSHKNLGQLPVQSFSRLPPRLQDLEGLC